MELVHGQPHGVHASDGRHRSSVAQCSAAAAATAIAATVAATAYSPYSNRQHQEGSLSSEIRVTALLSSLQSRSPAGRGWGGGAMGGVVQDGQGGWGGRPGCLGQVQRQVAGQRVPRRLALPNQHGSPLNPHFNQLVLTHEEVVGDLQLVLAGQLFNRGVTKALHVRQDGVAAQARLGGGGACEAGQGAVVDLLSVGVGLY